MQERKAGKAESVGAESSSTLSEKTVTPEEKIQNHKRDNKQGLFTRVIPQKLLRNQKTNLHVNPHVCLHTVKHKTALTFKGFSLFMVDLSRANRP